MVLAGMFLHDNFYVYFTCVELDFTLSLQNHICYEVEVNAYNGSPSIQET